jgi:hypothetical protein
MSKYDDKMNLGFVDLDSTAKLTKKQCCGSGYGIWCIFDL